MTQLMPLQIGQQLGSYEITSLLGKGGMGEVYRGRDGKLKRDVAIKILPEEFSRDPDRAADSSVKRKFSRRLTTPISRRSTISKRRTVHVTWCSNLSRAKRWPSGSHADRSRLGKLSILPSTSVKHSKPRMRKASF